MSDLDQAWVELCDQLRTLGPDVVRADLADIDRAEGYRFVLRQLRIAVEAALENADPAHPLFHHGTGPDKKLLLDNPDVDYLVAPVDPAFTYRVTGTVGTCCYAVDCYTLEPGTQLVVEGVPPEARNWSLYVMNRWSESFRTETDPNTSLNSSQVVYEPDGSFRIVISAERPIRAANWLNTHGRTEGWMALRWLCATGEVALPTCHVAPLGS